VQPGVSLGGANTYRCVSSNAKIRNSLLLCSLLPSN
jgi:hypothetical protein